MKGQEVRARFGGGEKDENEKKMFFFEEEIKLMLQEILGVFWGFFLAKLTG